MNHSGKTSFANIINALPPSVAAGIEPPPKLSDFVEKEQLGKGSFGQVWKGVHKETLEEYAIKEIEKKKADKEYINREVEIMYRLNHKNIAKLYSHFETDTTLYFVMEYCSGGNLYTLKQSQRNKRFDDKKVAYYASSLAYAVNFLHNQNPPIIHRDIKLENLLLNSSNVLKLTDFGWSAFLSTQEKRETYCGTKSYMPPEIINNQAQDHNVDIWCMGILIYELAVGKLPFTGDDFTMTKSILSGKIDWPQDINIQLRDLLTKILKVEPNKRLQIKDILNHPYIVENISKHHVGNSKVSMDIKLSNLDEEEIGTRLINNVSIEYIMNKKKYVIETPSLILQPIKQNTTSNLSKSKPKESRLGVSMHEYNQNLSELDNISSFVYNNTNGNNRDSHPTIVCPNSADVGDLKSTIELLHNENKELKKELKIKTERLGNETLRLVTELEAKYNEVTELKRENTNLSKIISEQTITLENYKSNFRFYSDELDDKEKVILNLKKEKTSLEDSVKKYEMKIGDQRQNNESKLLKDKEILNEKLYELEDEIRKIKLALSLSEEETKSLRAENKMIQNSTSSHYDFIIKDYEEKLKSKELENYKLIQINKQLSQEKELNATRLKGGSS